MTPRQRRALAFLKEWGPLIGGGLGLLSSLGLGLVAFGFGLTTPATLFAQLDKRVSVLERDRGGIVGLQRYFCYRDRPAASLFIPCDALNGNTTPSGGQ